MRRVVLLAPNISQLVITSLNATSLTAGGAVTFNVTAEDNTVPTYIDIVQLTSRDGHAMAGTIACPTSRGDWSRDHLKAVASLPVCA